MDHPESVTIDTEANQDACEAMGPENAAATMACILERAGHINSAGGYLRNLSDKARRGERNFRSDQC
ncbi:hypothetical protein ASD02_23110 [Ensifer sp. Root1252]|nr:hypothetical protein ASD02_23110 [Ensifer sp. Root1252]KRC77932.1 hypothetical protein ASE32_27720 [Ensifer sp. Root231]KRD00352.1 hypothetical protein ASE47_23680 [Ensifer sp. Root258]